MIIFKDFDTSMISGETVTIPKNVFAAKCSKEFNADPVSNKLEPLLCEILTICKYHCYLMSDPAISKINGIWDLV